MNGDIGRIAAALLAIILIFAIPVLIRADNFNDIAEYEIQAAMDEFTADIAETGRITTDRYERLSERLGLTGVRADISIIIGIRESGFQKQTGIYDKDESSPESGTKYCAVHVHTQECFTEHNHAVNGCIYHAHGPECYCPGRMTDCYRSEHSTWICSMCRGSGTQEIRNECSDCHGTGEIHGEVVCHLCKGKGTCMVSTLCDKCGGTGYTSNGKTCSKCDGYKYMEFRDTCTVCGGSGIRKYDSFCPTCVGHGYITSTGKCPYCSGNGGGTSSTDYYRCSVCKQGSVTTWGGSCGRKLCEYGFDGYQCGIAANDTHPVCDSVIVDVSYKSEQKLYTGESPESLENELEVTYLDGSKGTVYAEVLYGPETDTSIPGNYQADLAYEGYYLKAGNFERKRFPVNITVLPRSRICEVCGNTYYLLRDGSDMGCPFCYKGITGIRVVCTKTEYRAEESFEAEVYAVYNDHEERIPEEEVWNSFDGNVNGPQTVIIGYLEYIAGVDVFVSGADSGNLAPEGTSEDGPTPTSAESVTPNPTSAVTGVPTSGPTPGITGEGQPESGTDEGGAEYSESGIEKIGITGYAELIGTEEVIELLYRQGEINLKYGDSVSVGVKVTRSAGAFGGLFTGRRKTEFTSGIIVHGER